MLRFPTVTTGQCGGLREMAGNCIESRSTKMATNNNLLVSELIDRVSELSQAIATNQTENINREVRRVLNPASHSGKYLYMLIYNKCIYLFIFSLNFELEFFKSPISSYFLFDDCVFRGKCSTLVEVANTKIYFRESTENDIFYGSPPPLCITEKKRCLES